LPPRAAVDDGGFFRLAEGKICGLRWFAGRANPHRADHFGMTRTRLRQLIDAAVADLGHDPEHCKESVLTKEGYYAGRKFRYEGVKAIWLAEDETAKILDDDGRLLGTINTAVEPMMIGAIGDSDDQAMKRAA
jgi:hypothetical protein